MRQINRFFVLAAFVCCMTTAYAQGDYDKYEHDNETYGTTPFINLSDMPKLFECMPAHPSFESPEFAYDMVRYLWGKQQREDEERVKVAVDDAEWNNLEKVYANWKDAFGLEVTKVGTPKIYALLNKSLRTTDPTRRSVKALYSRQRPFERYNDSMPSHEEDDLRGEGSYPSGHTLRGWTITLLMIQIAPERAAEIYRRGMDYGFSRVIVGAHWQSDVDNSRMAAGLLFSVLQTNEDFQTMMKEAQQEYKEKQAESVQSPAVNKTSNNAARLYTIDGRPVDEDAHGIIVSAGQKIIAK
jgi:acid phosphatase (class A)